MRLGCRARWPRKGWEGPAACGGVQRLGADYRAEPSTAPPDDPTPSVERDALAGTGIRPKYLKKIPLSG